MFHFLISTHRRWTIRTHQRSPKCFIYEGTAMPCPGQLKLEIGEGIVLRNPVSVTPPSTIALWRNRVSFPRLINPTNRYIETRFLSHHEGFPRNRVSFPSLSHPTFSLHRNPVSVTPRAIAASQDNGYASFYQFPQYAIKRRNKKATDH